MLLLQEQRCSAEVCDEEFLVASRVLPVDTTVSEKGGSVFCPEEDGKHVTSMQDGCDTFFLHLGSKKVTDGVLRCF